MTAGAFRRTRSALDADSVGRSIGLLAVAALLVAAWSAWALLAHIALYETSDLARLETDREAHLVLVRALDPSHPHIATCAENYAELMRDRGRDEEADALDARYQRKGDAP